MIPTYAIPYSKFPSYEGRHSEREKDDYLAHVVFDYFDHLSSSVESVAGHSSTAVFEACVEER